MGGRGVGAGWKWLRWDGGRGDSRLRVTYLFVCACVRTSAEDDKFPGGGGGGGGGKWGGGMCVPNEFI